MGEESKKLLIGAASIFTLFLVGSLCSDNFGTNGNNPFQSWRTRLPTPTESVRPREFNTNVPVVDSQEFSLRRLVRGQDRFRLDQEGFSCYSELHSEVCVAKTPVVLDSKALTVYIPSNGSRTTRSIKPYPRKEDETAMKEVTLVSILTGKFNPPACDFNHSVPAVVFSSGGFVGNLFHEFNELIIPLFITCRHFQSRLKFIVTDYQPWWVRKYDRILSHLSEHEPLNATADHGVHCFPGAVIGLKYHENLALNTTEIPGGQSMFEFRHFLRQVYNLKTKTVSEFHNAKPVLLFVSRQKTRRFLNEGDMLRMFEALGYKVVVVTPDMMSNLDEFARVVNSGSVMVGAHGAGLTNALFLPEGAVVVQVVPLGLEWASQAYYGGPTRDMGLHYVEYRLEPEESSLSEKYGRDDPVIKDPPSVFAKGYYVGRAIYFDGQDFTINLERFRKTLVQAMDRLRLSNPRE